LGFGSGIAIHADVYAKVSYSIFWLSGFQCLPSAIAIGEVKLWVGVCLGPEAGIGD